MSDETAGPDNSPSNVEQLDPMGYTDEEFYRAKCADLENEVKRLRGEVATRSDQNVMLDVLVGSFEKKVIAVRHWAEYVSAAEEVLAVLYPERSS